MTKTNRRWAKWAVSAAILASGILPSSCALRFRDALLNGAATFTSGSVVNLLNAFVPVQDILGQ